MVFEIGWKFTQTNCIFLKICHQSELENSRKVFDILSEISVWNRPKYWKSCPKCEVRHLNVRYLTVRNFRLSMYNIYFPTRKILNSKVKQSLQKYSNSCLFVNGLQVNVLTHAHLVYISWFCKFQKRLKSSFLEM